MPSVPPLPAGRYRVYGDIVHESGYAQTMVSSVEIAGDAAGSAAATDPDDSSFTGSGLAGGAIASYDLGDGTRLVWERGDAPIDGRRRTRSALPGDAMAPAPKSRSSPTWAWRRIS